MLSKVFSASVLGVDGYSIEIEVDVTRGLPSMVIVGLPDASVKEARDRVKSAIENSGFTHPPKKITVNLAPAHTKKEGPSFDLPIALGILAATGQINSEKLQDYAAVGELALNGRVRSVKGVLPMALKAKKDGMTGILVPIENVKEAAVVRGLEAIAVKNLSEAVQFILGEKDLPPCKIDLEPLFDEDNHYETELRDVKGQVLAKRALEIAACGGHHMIMIGPPGSGKTLLAKCLPSLLPLLSLEEALETTKIHSVAGVLGMDQSLLTLRPFRSPHHTISDIGLIGGGSFPRPGEVSLAHHGVLFLDELPEFKRNVLEVLRQPLEDGKITISRASASLTYPSNFMLVAAMNPCPCGYFTDHRRECRCTPAQVQRYRTKISGPLLDRIDLHVEVAAVKTDELTSEGETQSEDTRDLRQRVIKLRKFQSKRLEKEGLYVNGQMNIKQIKKYCRMDSDAKNILKMAVSEMGFSARSYDRILKVARTIADMDERELIESNHISEAIQYRSLDRALWN